MHAARGRVQQQDRISTLCVKLADREKAIKEKDRLLNSTALTLERAAKRLRSGTEAEKEQACRERSAAHLCQAEPFAEAKLKNELKLESGRKLENEKVDKDQEKVATELKKLAGEPENKGKPSTVIATTYTPENQRDSDDATASGSQSSDAKTKKKTASPVLSPVE